MNKKILTLIIIGMLTFTLCSCGGSGEVKDLSGDYQDEISMRATLTLTKTEDDNYEIGINWPISSFEGVCWTATGTFDGKEIAYEDGECRHYLYNEEGDQTLDEVTEKDLKGSLVVGDKIEWCGSNEEETAMFVKIGE